MNSPTARRCFNSPRLPSLQALLGALAFVLAWAPTQAAAHIEWTFVGISTTSVAPQDGVPALNAACQADFAADSRMCTTGELLAAPNMPASGPSAWIGPDIRGGAGTNVVDASGLISAQGALNCSGYVGGGSHIGYYTNGQQFTSWACSASLPVVCCERVAATVVPSMTALGGGGRALIVALMVLTLGTFALRRGRVRGARA